MLLFLVQCVQRTLTMQLCDIYIKVLRYRFTLLITLVRRMYFLTDENEFSSFYLSSKNTHLINKEADIIHFVGWFVFFTSLNRLF